MWHGTGKPFSRCLDFSKSSIRDKDNLCTVTCYTFQKDIEEKTTSLWTWLNVAAMSNPDEYKNMRYNSYKKQR